MDTLAEKILKSPDAPNLIRAVQKILQEQTQQRQDFREWVDEGTKAEFINGEVIVHSPVKKKTLGGVRFFVYTFKCLH